MKAASLGDSVSFDHPKRGLKLMDLGDRGNLNLMIKQFKPMIECEQPSADGPDPEDCEELLPTMPTWRSVDQFGRRGRAGLEVELPIIREGGKLALS